MNRETLSIIGFVLLALGLISQRGRTVLETAMESGKEILMGLKRGERLNNPGNIRHSADRWQGMTENQPDSSFVAFVSPEYGFRAMARIIATYVTRYNVRTVADVITRWAPPSENPTVSYASFVAEKMGVAVDTPLDLLDLATLQALLNAITIFEQGRNIFEPVQLTQGIIISGVA